MNNKTVLILIIYYAIASTIAVTVVPTGFQYTFGLVIGIASETIRLVSKQVGKPAYFLFKKSLTNKYIYAIINYKLKGDYIKSVK